MTFVSYSPVGKKEPGSVWRLSLSRESLPGENGERVFVPMSSRSQKVIFQKRKEMPWYEVAVSLSDRWGWVSAHILDFPACFLMMEMSASYRLPG